MRYLLVGFLLFVVLVLSVAGLRGRKSRHPPLEIFPDMDRQLKLRPQNVDEFFPDGRSSRLPVPGTIARATPYQLSSAEPQRLVYPFEDSPVNTGRLTGSTNFVETNPFEITPQFIQRGRERFNINCSPCHGPLADGNGITKKLGLATVANLHDPRIVRLADGEIFYVITNGRNTMYPYGGQVPVEDRWAIIAYLRALQLSQLGTVEDVPEPERSLFNK
jgi:Cytochrome C oxidase, cbb3-type, subunit III